MNSFTFTLLPQGPYKSRETEESHSINISSKHTHHLMLRYPSHVTQAFGSNEWTAARLCCLIKPLKSPSYFIYKGKLFHVTDYFHCCYVFLQTFWLANPVPFSSCNHDWEEALPRPTNATALNKLIPEVCNFSMNPKCWNCSQQRLWNLRKGKQFPWIQGFRSHLLKWYHTEDNSIESFLHAKQRGAVISSLFCS